MMPHKSKRAARVEWLARNANCWKGYRLTGRDGTARILFQMMQVAGLYSWSTNWFDARIERLIQRARDSLRTNL